MVRLRPFCRATDHPRDPGAICHRMLGHSGPHRMRFDRVGAQCPTIEWFSVAVEYLPLGVAQ